MKLNTHLNFGGNCEAAFRFYEKLLGGTVAVMMKAKDLPPGSPRPPDAGDEYVIHARLEIAGGALVGNDVPKAYFQPIRSSYLYLALDTAEEAERVYAGLAEGGKIGMAIQETFFATRFAQLRDRFGVLWTLLHPRAR